MQTRNNPCQNYSQQKENQSVFQQGRWRQGIQGCHGAELRGAGFGLGLRVYVYMLSRWGGLKIQGLEISGV